MKTAFNRWTAARWVLLAAVVSGWCTGCGQNRAEVRVYREIRVSPDAPPPRSSPHGSPPAMVPAAPPSARTLAWDTPDSWVESPGTGMRLASFTVGGSEDEGLCTLITLSGPAGGLQPNVARWLGQLDLPVPDDTAFAAFLDSQQRFETQDGLPGVLVDLVPLTREAGTREDSMMVGVVTVGAQTAFLKLTGPLAFLEQEKGRLEALSRSLHIQP